MPGFPLDRIFHLAEEFVPRDSWLDFVRAVGTQHCRLIEVT
jgi:hypothetical protein